MINLTFLQNSQISLPFLFVFAIVFGVLEISSPIKNRAVNIIISVVIAIFAASNTAFVSMLWGYFPTIASFFILMFFVVFIMKVFGGGKKEKMYDFDSMIVYGVVLLLLFTVGYNVLRHFSFKIPYIGGVENIILIVGLILIIGMFWYASRWGIIATISAAKKEK